MHLFLHPIDAAAAAEIVDQRLIHIAQMGDVGDRVRKLRLGERAARPVGEAVRFVERIAGDALDELIVGNRIAVAEHHGGDLRIENRVGDQLGPMPDDFDVLARRMENLHHLFVRHQFEERREIDAGRQRIDHDRFLGRGHLRHAQERIVGGLAQEFGVDGDERERGHAPASRGEFRSRRNRLH